MEGFAKAGGLINKAKFKRRPRYTVVLHDVREKLGLSLNTYVVIDSIHKLSTSDPKFPYCIMSKPNMAEFLQLAERTLNSQTKCTTLWKWRDGKDLQPARFGRAY